MRTVKTATIVFDEDEVNHLNDLFRLIILDRAKLHLLQEGLSREQLANVQLENPIINQRFFQMEDGRNAMRVMNIEVDVEIPVEIKDDGFVG